MTLPAEPTLVALFSRLGITLAPAAPALAASSFQFWTAATVGASGGSFDLGATPLLPAPASCVGTLPDATAGPAAATASDRPVVCLMGFGGW